MRKYLITTVLVIASIVLTGCEDYNTLSPEAARMILDNREKHREEFKKYYEWCRSMSIVGCWEVSEKKFGMYSKYNDDYIRERALLVKKEK